MSLTASPPRAWLAWAAVVATVLIWSSFLVSARAAVTSPLGPVEVGLMRFVPATLLFLPVLLRHGPVPKTARPRDLVLVGVGGGFGFILLLTSGLNHAPVADSGVLAPGMLPLYVALLSAVFLGERFGGLRRAGFVLILAGGLAVGGWDLVASAEPGAWRGHLLFTAAAMVWAVYTVAFRASDLDPIQAAAMICFWGAVAFGLLGLVVGVSFAGVGTGTLALQTVLQGVLSGFTSTLTYGYATRHLGASRVAAFGALVPVLAALGAWIALSEPVGAIKLVGILVTATGVALASGAFSRARPTAQPAPSPSAPRG